MTDEQLVYIWGQLGKALPHPGHFGKQRIIKEFGRRFGLTTFIETGTFVGYTVWAMLDSFQAIISIELDDALYESARNEFSHYPHVTVLHGDSGQLMGSVLAPIAQPCLFWLDGHYSGGLTGKGSLETPVLQELEHIFSHPVKDHVILIDDAHLFNGTHDYPSIEALEACVMHRRPDCLFEVNHDIIRIHPCS